MIMKTDGEGRMTEKIALGQDNVSQYEPCTMINKCTCSLTVVYLEIIVDSVRKKDWNILVNGNQYVARNQNVTDKKKG